MASCIKGKAEVGEDNLNVDNIIHMNLIYLNDFHIINYNCLFNQTEFRRGGHKAGHYPLMIVCFVAQCTWVNMDAQKVQLFTVEH